ncbi:hypothetical protein GQ55_8G055900 [Panicum hallii var. hallii]|uniref:Uncharacterized protein n=1 Tax=Panicum hallii var. hallii TaxID=1504633 RepID=A0A2T7CL33_9POAL|nr:hypothetical protein GQ55_8G055900 [Panicum hallii var. hallii]
MAEAFVGLLISKLGMALGKEAATYGASQFSKEASDLRGLKFKDTNETTSIFARRIQDLAFQIEDVVDEFTYKLEDDKHIGFASKTKKRIRHINIWGRLALELRRINVELEDATKRRDRYTMLRIGKDNGSEHHVRSNNQIVCLPRKEDLVGIEDSVDELKRWLVSDFDERNSKLVTVWGMGGVGKTTLVDHVYNIVKKDFDAAAWVTVSKNYQVEDLLRKIAREFGISVDANNMELRSLVADIRKYLEGKRYILVLDDVWEKDVWINIMDVFPINCISRFVLTSRKHEVASLATSNCAIQLEPLGENDSWKLFCNVAFRNDACIGRLLSCKPPTYSAWKNLYDELELQSTTNVIQGVNIILKVSFEDLPYELKNCFLHCAIFPEDYHIKRRRLIRHRITAGFIKKQEKTALEQVAEGYLNELVSRSLLQVAKTNEFGRVTCCRMHDVIRCLALEKAERESFAKVYGGSGRFWIGTARRLSIQSTNIATLSESGAMRFRAIHAFTSYVDIDLLKPMLASSNLISTLDLQDTQIKMLPNEVFNLFNLRFLGLRNTGIEILPEAVGRLQNLEVLDAFGTALLSLPEGVAKLKKLRYLYASALLTEGTVTDFGGVKVPRGIRNLTGLHALQKVKASSETLCDVEALELRTFSVCNVTSENSLNLCHAIMSMRHLVHLSISASNETEILPLQALNLPGSLSKLYLDGQLEKKRLPQIFSAWSYFNNLTRLSLALSKLDENTFSKLVVLSGLCYLRLFKAYDGKKLCFSAQSFPVLRQLEICDAPHLNHIEIEEGALESLVELELAECPELKCLPEGIVYLRALEQLRLADTAEELIEKVRQESEANGCNEEVAIMLSEKNRLEILP